MPNRADLGRMPVVYLPHGGGPCFFMDWTMGPADTWDAMAAWLRQLSEQVGERPAAIVVVSGHWEESVVTIGANPSPPLMYDYSGFPEHTYRIEYPTPGSVSLAGRIGSLLAAAGIESRQDPDRGLDHGVIVPLKLVYPDAGIPVVPVSLRADLAAAFHLELGRALAPLREQVFTAEVMRAVVSGYGFGMPGGPDPLASRFRPARQTG